MTDMLLTVVRITGYSRYVSAFNSMSRAVNNNQSAVNRANNATIMANVSNNNFINNLYRRAPIAIQGYITKLLNLVRVLGLTRLGLIDAAAALVGIALIFTTKFIMNTVKEFDLLRMQLDQIFGGSGPGQKAMNWAKKFALEGKASVDATVGAFRFLTRVGIQPTIKIMNTLADVAAMTKKYTMADVAKAAAYAVQMNQWQMMHRTVGIHKRQVMALAPEAFDSSAINARIIDQKKAWDAIMKLMQQPHFRGAASRRALTTVEGRQQMFKSQMQNWADSFKPVAKPLQLNWLKMMQQGFTMLKPIIGPLIMGLMKFLSASIRVTGSVFRFVNVILKLTKLDKMLPVVILAPFFALAAILDTAAHLVEILCYWLEKLAKWMDRMESRAPLLKKIGDWFAKILGLDNGSTEAGIPKRVQDMKTLINTLVDLPIKPLKDLVELFDKIRDYRIDKFEQIGDAIADSISLFSENKVGKSKIFETKLQAINFYMKALKEVHAQTLAFQAEASSVKTNSAGLPMKDAVLKYLDIQKDILKNQTKEYNIKKKIYQIVKDTNRAAKEQQEILGGGDLAKQGIRQWEVWKKVSGSLQRSIQSPHYKITVDANGEEGLKGFIKNIVEQTLQQNTDWAAQAGMQAGNNLAYNWR